MKVMIHKIHGAEALSTPYVITGFGNAVFDFSTVVYPQDVRNCTTCHEETDTDTPEASNWRLVANRESCGSCHDSLMANPLNPGSGVMNHPGGLVFSDDTQCLSCHGPGSTVNGGAVQTAAAHMIPLDVQSAKFAYQVVSVTDSGGGTLESGDTPRVTIRVTDPTNNNAPYDIQQVGGPFLQSSASLNVDLAWTGSEFSNMGPIPTNTATATPFQPLRVGFANGAAPVAGVTNNGDGTFTANAAAPQPNRADLFPAGADAALETGGLVGILEGRPRVDTDGDGAVDSSAQVAGAGGAFAWDGDSTARLERVEITRCNQCHEVLSLHGGNRTDNTELCATCHNPNATDIRQRGAGACTAVPPTATQAPMTGANADVSIDLRYMIHAIHSGPRANYVVCGNGNSVHDFSEVHYPGKLNNCEGCHLPPTETNPSYYGRDPATMLAVSVDAGADRLTIMDDQAMSPTTAACAGCHTDSLALAHMRQNGGSGDVATGTVVGPKQAIGSVTNSVETCAVCHAEGRSADIRVVHGIEQFRYNSSN
jgi:OmcA/MtrC family decaheme c-type cytochrome